MKKITFFLCALMVWLSASAVSDLKALHPIDMQTYEKAPVTVQQQTFNRPSSMHRLQADASITFQDNYLIYTITGYNPNTVEVTGHVFSTSTTLDLIIPDSVTYNGENYEVKSIGSQVFNNCSGITSVTIPTSIDSIGLNAFNNCSNLQSVTWNAINCKIYSRDNNGSVYYSDTPFANSSSISSFTFGNAVEVIPVGICYGLTSLSTVSISENVNAIASGAFSGCNSLASISIPDGVTEISYRAFYNCNSLSTINIPSGVEFIRSQTFSHCSNLTSIVIPDGVTTIEYEAFWNCSSLTSISIPETVQTIGHLAFYNCSSLTTIHVPQNITALGGAVFYGCVGLTSVNWNAKSCVITTGYSSDYNYNFTTPFDHCSNITSIAFGDSVYIIPDYLCNDMTGLTTITIPNSVTEIGHYAFYNTGLVSVVVPENIQSTGNRAFGYCTNLQSVVWNAINCTTYDDGQYVYPPFQESPNITSFTIGNGVQNIPNGLCFGTMITEIEIPNSVTTIGGSAFRECSALTTMNIPNSVTTIGGSVFYSCNNLNSITISENITRINNYTFYGCSSLTSLSIPENVQVIGYEAFSNCGNLSTILIPQNVSYLADDAFSGCNNLTSVMWNAQNCAVGNQNNYNYDESGNRISYWRDATSSPFPSSVQTFIFGNQVERIPNYLCYGLSSLSSINISESVTEIGEYAFAECTGLDSVVIPLNVDTMGDYAFNNCTNLTSVVWNAKHCADFATYEGTPFASIYNHITSFIFGNQVERIPYGLCHWMHKLTSISIPNSVIEIGNSAFNSCQGLRSIILPESLKQIGYRAFRNCDGLQSITIPKNVEVVFNEVFMDCDSLRSVVWNASNRWCTTPHPDLTDVSFFPTTVERFTFGNGVQYIPHHLCNGMDKLTSVILPNSLKEIGVGAFQDCIGLTSILIPDSVSYICKDAFSGCNNLNFVIWNARSCQNIDYEVSSYDSINKFYYFQEIPNSSCPFSPTIQTFIFGDNVQLIPAGICREMNLLSSIALPNTVTEIGQYAFCDCSGLISFTMEEGVNAILSGGFAGCSNLLQITLPNSLTNIGEFAFDGCSNLTTITIGNRVDTIGKSAFEDCIRLMSIVLPTSINQIGESAFYNCSSMNKAIVRSTAELNPYCMLLLNPQIDTIIAPASIFDIDEQHRLDYVCTKRMKYVKANSGELTEDAFAVIRRSASTLETLDVAATTNTTMADEAFSNMYNLTTLALPQNLERISYMAVAGCKMLPSISIPATVTEIGTSAFEHCRSLQTVTFDGNNLTTIGNWAFYNNHALQQLTIPAGVTTIGAGAFYGCTYLEDLAMPASLRNVGDNAFALCNHLTKMQVEADLPPMVAARTFFDVSRNIPVYVPDETVNDYRNTAIWQEFFIRPISQAATGIETVRESGSDSQNEMLPDGKFFQNGKLLIRRNGKTYDITGSLID